VDRWRAIGASITGSGHKSSAIPCQDAHLISSTSDGLLIIAVADGAGSAKYADRASQLCVKNAVEAIYPSLGENKLGEHELACLLRGAFRSVRESLINEANVNTSGKANDNLAEYSSTLLICLITPLHVATLHIGDGAAVGQDRDGSLLLLSAPQHGEFINQTRFITDSDFAERSSFNVCPAEQLIAIALFTDGIEQLAIAGKKEPFTGFFLPLFGYGRNPSASSEVISSFLQSERVCNRTDDDKTLVIATRVVEERLPV
jgi:serine/threonine protein phosphatase PrpC